MNQPKKKTKTLCLTLGRILGFVCADTDWITDIDTHSFFMKGDSDSDRHFWFLRILRSFSPRSINEANALSLLYMKSRKKPHYLFPPILKER